MIHTCKFSKGFFLLINIILSCLNLIILNYIREKFKEKQVKAHIKEKEHKLAVSIV